jgi:phosphoribosylcarboxyaminoimidazole (NCAIR) mutase
LTVVDPKNAVAAVLRILSNNNTDLRKRLLEHIQNIKSKFNN